MQVTVQDVMTRSPIAVPSETTIDEVLETLVTEGVPSVYVTTRENRLAGIVTDYEVLKHQVLGGDRTQTAETLMNRNVATVRPEESALAVCPQFRDGRLARMAVIDGEGHLIGNLARRDIMRMMLTIERMTHELPAPIGDPTRSDAARVVPAPRSAQLNRKSPAALCCSASSFDAVHAPG
jgi:CBS-domain-containing membrane protein